MPLIAGIDEIRQAKGSVQMRLDAPIKSKQKFVFFRAIGDTPVAPSAYINQYNPDRVSSAHYHVNDQFQIIVAGKGTFGRHNVSPYTIHFSRGYTPYGPLHADAETGWAFLVLRTRYDPGPFRTAQEAERLKQVPDRHPWQITKKVTFPPAANGISVHDDPEIKDDQGLFASTLAMSPNTELLAPDPSTGDGQFVVVVKGSLMHQAREHLALSVIFIKPDEERFSIHAGSQGLEGLILNMPMVKQREKERPTPAARTGAKKWQCLLCAFAYDEMLGLPGEGIPAGTPWEDVPESWTCPDCSASKSDFEMVEV